MKKIIMATLLMGLLSGNMFAQDDNAKKDWSKYSSIGPYFVKIEKSFEAKKYKEAIKQQQEICDIIDKYIPKNMKSFKRLISYITPLILLRKNGLLKNERLKIFNYTLKGFADNKIEHDDKNRLARSVMRYIKKADIDTENKKMIANAFKNKVADNRYFVELIYMVKVDGAEKYLENLSSQKIRSRNTETIRESGSWGAKLILAESKKGKYIDKIFKRIKSLNNKKEEVDLLQDLQAIKDKKIVGFLIPFLNSDKRESQLKPTLPGEPIARSAALVLEKLLVGFPKGNYYDFKDIKKCREWMKKQKEWKFK